MALKLQYIFKFICFRFLPCILIYGLLSAVFIFLASTNKNIYELSTAIIICAIVFIVYVAYSGFNIVRFLVMIKRQERQHGVVFDDKNPIALAKCGLWVVCSDNWLIRPGKIAIFRKEIHSVSIADGVHSRGGPLYPVRIKTIHKKSFKLNFKNETDARLVKKWARL